MKKKSKKTSLSKFSPIQKINQDINLIRTSFRKSEMNNILSSPEKIKEEIYSPKKKGIFKTTYHRKTKSSSQVYVPYITNNNINVNNNNSISRISFILKNDINNCNNKNKLFCSTSRNRYEIFKKRFNNYNNKNKKSSNLLSISFSLKDFRNNIINTFMNSEINGHKNEISNKYSNNTNKNNKSLLNFDNLNNIEETRNTTSITGFNNSNLLCNFFGIFFSR